MPYFQASELSGSAGNAVSVASTGILPVRRPVPIADDVGTIMAFQGTIQFASGVNLVLNDVIEFLILPADHVPVDYILTCDQFDSNAAATFAVALGVMTGAVGDTARTQANVGAEGGTAIKCGGATTVNTTRAGFTNGSGNNAYVAQYFSHTIQRVAPSFTTDRSFGLAVTAAAATNPATVRRMDLTLFCRVARFGA